MRVGCLIQRAPYAHDLHGCGLYEGRLPLRECLSLRREVVLGQSSLQRLIVLRLRLDPSTAATARTFFVSQAVIHRHACQVPIGAVWAPPFLATERGQGRRLLMKHRSSLMVTSGLRSRPQPEWHAGLEICSDVPDECAGC